MFYWSRSFPTCKGGNIPRKKWSCWHCPSRVGEEEHLILDYIVFAFHRGHHARLFKGQQTIHGFMNHGSQNDKQQNYIWLPGT